MTHPYSEVPYEPPDYYRNWYLRYQDVEGAYTREVAAELLAAAGAAKALILRDVDRTNIGAVMRRAQLMAARKALAQLLKHMYSNVQGIITRGQRDAAVAAVRAGQHDVDDMVKRLFPDVKQRNDFRAQQIAQAERGVDAMMMRVLKTRQPLSKRVYYTQNLSKGWVDRIVNVGIARGAPAREIAKQVESSIKPNVPGGVSYAAMRLARTEIGNAFHAQSIADAQANPLVDNVRWHLSGRHVPDPGDLCEEYAAHGVYPVTLVPNRPHPNCRCYIVPELVGWDEFRANLYAGKYDDLGGKVFAA